MKKFLITGIVCLILVNITAFTLLFSMYSGGKSETSDEIKEIQPSYAATPEEKEYFLTHTLPYYEKLAEDLDAIWQEHMLDNLVKIENGELGLELFKLPLSTLKLKLERLQKEADIIPVESLSEPISERVLESIELFNNALEDRIKACYAFVLTINNKSFSDAKMQEISDIINEGDTYLIESNDKFYTLSSELGIIGSGSAPADNAASQPVSNIENQNTSLLEPELHAFFEDMIDEKIGYIEKTVSKAIDARIQYSDGEIELEEAVFTQDALWAELDEFFETYQMPPLKPNQNKQLYNDLKEDFESVKIAYLDHAFAQKQMTFAIANKRNDPAMAFNPEGYTDSDYEDFREEAQKTMDITLDETLAFYTKISNLVYAE